MPVLRSQATAESFANPAHKKRRTRTTKAIRTVLDQEYAEKGLKPRRREVLHGEEGRQLLNARSVTQRIGNRLGAHRERKIRSFVLRFWDWGV
jgi:hypothetical protein